MNSIVEIVALAKKGTVGPKVRGAEASYLAARNVFGATSAEAQGAMTYWARLNQAAGDQSTAQRR